MQVEEACKKRKYVMKDLVITLIEDDVELVTDKVQDRGEEVVCIEKAQREEIMAKIIEFHETLQQISIQAVPQATTH
jgi:nucleoside-triphosphatase THEP1